MNTLNQLSIVKADNHLVRSEDGLEYTDLFCGAGTAFLGHANPSIRTTIQEQLNKVWITGTLTTPVGIKAKAMIEGFFPRSHQLAGLYSTGMEAAEFALRIARVSTGRKGVVSFEHCMHGKSTATAYLGWSNDLVTLPDSQRLPYVSRCSEEQILEILAETLALKTTSAVFVEPLQGSSGGHQASAQFFQKLSGLCHEHGTLLVVDEIFAGFYRTGTVFLHQAFGITPDIVLIGKAMGNGFPVSGVVVDRKYPIKPAMLPGSTYAGNPLAAAAIVGTLSQMRELDLPSKVSSIEHTIVRELGRVTELGIAMRGKGALWILELPAEWQIDDVAARVIHARVLVSVTGAYLRLLPPATIPPDRLKTACAAIREICFKYEAERAKGS